MHVRDIIDAIARRDLSEIEAAFRAMVGYPGEERIDGATPVTLMACLDATCDALAHDTDLVPFDTINLLAEFEEEFGAIMDEGTYAEGAALVQACRAQWEWRYATLCRRAA